jgi:hypothetical protein
MRFLARSLALTGAGALALVGLSIPAASAAPTLSISTTNPAAYGPSSTTEVINGTAKFPNHTVSVILTDPAKNTSGQYWVTSDANGNWSYSFQRSDVLRLNDGTVTAKAGEYYCAGLTGDSPSADGTCPGLFGSTAALVASASKDFVKDTFVPGAPTISSAGASSVINGSNKSSVPVSGTGDNGDTVTVSLVNSSGTTVASGTATVSNGAWSLTLDASSAPDGNYTVKATQAEMGPLHNSSAAASTSVVQDTKGPTLYSTSPKNNTTIAAPASVAFAYHEELGASSTVEVSTSAGPVSGTVTKNTSGTITFKPASPGFKSATYTAKATVTDVHGNQTVSSISFTVDATAPAITNLKATNTSATSQNTTVTGTVSEKATLTFTSTDPSGNKATKSVSVAAGNFSVSYSEAALNGGPTSSPAKITVTVTAADPYGNSSTSSTTHTRTAPAVTAISLVVPTWSAVGWPITLKGQVSLKTANTYGSVTIVHTTLSGHQEIVATVRTNSTGAYSYTFTPTTSGSYYAIYNGDSKNSGVQSKSYKSELRYAISASSATGPATQKAVIGGAVHYPKAGAYVLIYKKNANGAWTQLGKAYIDSTSHYRFVVALPKGTTSIRVTIPPSNGYYGNSANTTATRT